MLIWTKYYGVTLIFSTRLKITLIVSYQALSVSFNCWTSILAVKKSARKFKRLKVENNCSYPSTFQEQTWWSAPNIQNITFSNFSASERDLAMQ